MKLPESSEVNLQTEMYVFSILQVCRQKPSNGGGSEIILHRNYRDPQRVPGNISFEHILSATARLSLSISVLPEFSHPWVKI